jgi:regulator of sigma E protease
VEEFGLGMGKKLWGKTKGEVEYTINAIPFGGFVRMLGEEGESKDPRSFGNAKLWKRMIITLAGVFMNFVLAIFVLTILFSVGTNPIIITQEEFDQAVEEQVIVLSEADEEGNQTIVDIQQIQKPVHEALVFATTESFRISKAIVHKVKNLPFEIYEKKGIPDDISGPLGIAEATHKILPQGFKAMLKLLAILSLSLGVMNLLPIPALDGGRFLFQLIELVTFRKPPEQWENAIHVGGFVLLMGLMVVITWNDIVRIFFS